MCERAALHCTWHVAGGLVKRYQKQQCTIACSTCSCTVVFMQLVGWSAVMSSPLLPSPALLDPAICLHSHAVTLQRRTAVGETPNSCCLLSPCKLAQQAVHIMYGGSVLAVHSAPALPGRAVAFLFIYQPISKLCCFMQPADQLELCAALSLELQRFME